MGLPIFEFSMASGCIIINFKLQGDSSTSLGQLSSLGELQDQPFSSCPFYLLTKQRCPAKKLLGVQPDPGKKQDSALLLHESTHGNSHKHRALCSLTTPAGLLAPRAKTARTLLLCRMLGYRLLFQQKFMPGPALGPGMW